jgi:serine/threonine protein kinase
MIGTVVHVDYDGTTVRSVQLDLPAVSKTSPVVVTTVDRIGQGSFGTVYRAHCDFATADIALKIASGKPNRLREELAVMSQVCTRGKINLSRQIFGALNADATIVVLGLELCLPQTLHDYLLSEPISAKGEMLALAYQTVCAVAAVHECGCCHRDVKHQNFVFDTEANLKLIDFGLASSSLVPPAGDVVAGTVSFMSPEMARNALSKSNRVSVGASADMWALGIVLFSIFTQKNPFPQAPSSDSKEKQNEALLRRVAAGDYSWPPDKKVPAALMQLVDSLLQVDPAKRPTAAALLHNKIWTDRHRTPSDRLLKFLGIQDADFLLRASPIHSEALRNAIAARSQQVSTSLNETIDSTGDAMNMSSQRITDSAGRKKPVREISVAIAEEAKRSQHRSHSRRAAPMSQPVAAQQKKTAASVASAADPPLADVAAPPARLRRNPAPVAAPPFASIADLVGVEKRQRSSLQALILATMLEMHQRMAMRLEEDVAQGHIFWIEPQRRSQAAHPHKFKEMDKVTKGYEYGFVCDVCDWEFLPNGKFLPYVHCSCGMDMCPGCFAKRQRTKSHQAPDKVAPASRGKRSRSGDSEANERTVSKAAQRRPDQSTKQLPLPKVADQKQAKKSVPQQLNRSKTSTAPPKSQDWEPIGRMAKAAEPVGALPTEAEQRMLLGGGWIRHFHYFPYPSGAGQPQAFTYRIQPDRTGAIFLTNECASFGAVSSSMERKMLVIEELDMAEGRDRTSVLTLTSAKCRYPQEFEILHQTATIDANLLKTQRCPGVVSVYQNPASAVRCNGEPFVYVRWFRCSEDSFLTAALLSNGAMQVFVGREYELRWMNDDRKFMVRSSGRCELINPATFKLMPRIDKLLFATQ